MASSVSRNVDFSLDGAIVVVTALESGQEIWRGTPYGHDALQVVSSPDHDVAAVLFDDGGDSLSDASNLVVIDHRGKARWRAEIPTSDPNDMYTSIELENGHLSAFSWSCHRVSFDFMTGEVLSTKYTK